MAQIFKLILMFQTLHNNKIAIKIQKWTIIGYT